MTHRKHRPTHIEMLCTVLGHAPGHTLTRDALYQELCSRYTPWSRTDFDTRLERALADDRCPVHAVRGAGNKVRWTGSERGGGSIGAGLYHDVANSLLTHGIPNTRCLDREVHVTANRHTTKGRMWVVQDLLVGGTSAGNPVLHSFEVEPETGFSVKSVYQSHAEGIGADYSWVIFGRGGRSDSLHQSADGDRIEWVAQQLGIGLISYFRPTVRSTWKVLRKPKRRAHTRAQEAALRSYMLVR